MRYALYWGVTRRERPACRSAPRPPTVRDSRTLKKSPPAKTKSFPREHPRQTKRAKFPPRMGGCSWGKFSVREGGLEGESPVFQEEALSLQGLLPFSLQGLSLSQKTRIFPQNLLTNRALSAIIKETGKNFPEIL